MTGRRYLDESHPYAGDLDLFGRGSLFQLLCQARTRLGEDTLGSWLLTAATPSTIDFRQRAISELRDRQKFSVNEKGVGDVITIRVDALDSQVNAHSTAARDGSHYI